MLPCLKRHLQWPRVHKRKLPRLLRILPWSVRSTFSGGPLLTLASLASKTVSQTQQPSRFEWRRTISSPPLFCLSYSLCPFTCNPEKSRYREAIDCIPPVAPESDPEQYRQRFGCQIPAHVLTCTVTIPFRLPLSDESTTKCRQIRREGTIAASCSPFGRRFPG